MKILFDECVPWPLRRFLAAHECRTAQFCGWGGKTNGELLQLAESQFDLFLTADQKMVYQQRVSGRRISILLLSTNDFDRIALSTQLVKSAIDQIAQGEYRELAIP
jgi:predicted nuclease of predicted toxin-antitoxin system